MNIKIHGKVRYIGKQTKIDSDKGTHSFKIIVIEINNHIN